MLVYFGMIYHVTTSSEWRACLEQDVYAPGAYASEGFIHASLRHQVSGVLQRYFRDQQDLLLLHINENKLSAPIKFEMAANQESFPHVYGKINKSAIERTESISASFSF
ncbi:MAG: DUF952 domain-containing protein [Bacteroidota bacterium]